MEQQDIFDNLKKSMREIRDSANYEAGIADGRKRAITDIAEKLENMCFECGWIPRYYGDKLAEHTEAKHSEVTS